jgi:hypothetical protein
VVTDRMLGMFRKEAKKTQPRKEGER